MKLALLNGKNIGCFIGLWIASLVIYVAFIPLIVDRNIFSSTLPIMAILATIIAVPIIILFSIDKKRRITK